MHNDSPPLLAAMNALAEAASPAVLRRVIHLLVDEESPMPTPVTDRMKVAAPAKTVKASMPAAALTASESSWLVLRDRVRTEQRRRKLDVAALARLLGFAASTTANALTTRRPPSAQFVAACEGWLVRPQKSAKSAKSVPVLETPEPLQRPPGALSEGVDPAEAVNGHADVGVNGHAAPLAAEIVLALRSKRNRTALTVGTLACELGIDAEDLDHALAGQPVPAEAIDVLQGWLKV